MSEPEKVALAEAFLIVWVDYGCEGWKPSPMRSTEEVAEFLLSGQSYGSPVVVTSGPRALVVDLLPRRE